jgi:mannitol/fructose-specific phosphotransferase system IIA component (Ntr-type)
LFFGISQKGLEYPGIDEKIFLIFVLITPQDHSTQRNLNILANLARILGSKKTVKKLREVKSMKEINDILVRAQGNVDTISI